MSTLLDLDELDLSTKCAEGFEFEYLDGNGAPTGILITVLGSDAPKVQQWTRKRINAQRTQAAVAAKRGKEVERTVEDDIDFGNEAAAIRVIGWKGIKQDCTFENALKLVTINSLVRDQVLKASNDLSNFTKGKSAT